jgi:hypothetical protein
MDRSIMSVEISSDQFVFLYMRWGTWMDIFRTKLLEVEFGSIISNIKLILQNKKFSSDPIRHWTT